MHFLLVHFLERFGDFFSPTAGFWSHRLEWKCSGNASQSFKKCSAYILNAFLLVSRQYTSPKCKMDWEKCSTFYLKGKQLQYFCFMGVESTTLERWKNMEYCMYIPPNPHGFCGTFLHRHYVPAVLCSTTDGRKEQIFAPTLPLNLNVLQ